MPQTSEYKIISGSPKSLQKEVAVLASKHWKPILMASCTGGVTAVVTIIMEHVLGS